MTTTGRTALVVGGMLAAGLAAVFLGGAEKHGTLAALAEEVDQHAQDPPRAVVDAVRALRLYDVTPEDAARSRYAAGAADAVAEILRHRGLALPSDTRARLARARRALER